MYNRRSPPPHPPSPRAARVWYNPYEPPPDNNWFLSGGGLRWAQPCVSPDPYAKKDESTWVLVPSNQQEQVDRLLGTASTPAADAFEDADEGPVEQPGGGKLIFESPAVHTQSVFFASALPSADPPSLKIPSPEELKIIGVPHVQPVLATPEKLEDSFAKLASPNAYFDNLNEDEVMMEKDASTTSGRRQEKLALGVETVFFDILSTEPLTLPFCASDPRHVKVFYAFLKGEKDEIKRTAMNNCVKLYVLKTLKRLDGKPYQPNGVMTRLRTLFALFKRRGIRFSLKTDFKYQGGFATYLESYWGKLHEQDSTFGSRPTKKSLPDDYGNLVRAGVQQGKVDASGNNVYELLALFAFSLGTMFGFRGVKVRTKLQLCRIFEI
jgi:hypothetical protein